MIGLDVRYTESTSKTITPESAVCIKLAWLGCTHKSYMRKFNKEMWSHGGRKRSLSNLNPLAYSSVV